MLFCLFGCDSTETAKESSDEEYEIAPEVIPGEDYTDLAPSEPSDEEFDISTDEDGNVVLNKYNGTRGDVVIPDNVTHIGKNAFDVISLSSSNGALITSVYIPDSVVSIGDYAFGACVGVDGGLTEVRMSSNISYIGEGAFADNSYLECIAMDSTPTHTVTIGDKAFAYCPNLTQCDVLNCENIEAGADICLGSPIEYNAG